MGERQQFDELFCRNRSLTLSFSTNVYGRYRGRKTTHHHAMPQGAIPKVFYDATGVGGGERGEEAHPVLCVYTLVDEILIVNFVVCDALGRLHKALSELYHLCACDVMN